jgi:hypothetical protein
MEKRQKINLMIIEIKEVLVAQIISPIYSLFLVSFFQGWFRIDKDFKSKSISENFD